MLGHRAHMENLVIIAIGERLILQFLLGHGLKQTRLARGCLQAPDDAGLQGLSSIVGRRIISFRWVLRQVSSKVRRLRDHLLHLVEQRCNGFEGLRVRLHVASWRTQDNCLKAALAALRG